VIVGDVPAIELSRIDMFYETKHHLFDLFLPRFQETLVKVPISHFPFSSGTPHGSRK